MVRTTKWAMILLAGCCLPGCVRPGPPPPQAVVPGPLARQVVAERVSAVLVAERESIQEWSGQRFAKLDANADVDGGSAAPITADGYFLTADHVLARVGRGWNAFVIYGVGSQLQTAKARVVWRSGSSDLALLHAPLATPLFYRWTPPQRWLAEGTWVIHGGIATGQNSPPGRLSTTLRPERWLTGARRFKLDFPLKPGDSGGPVVDAHGGLIGVNSAVEFLVPMETAFFVDSEGNRPNLRKLNDLIQRDRARNSRRKPDVE
jgi:S1-C subfamily serine protease